MAVVTLEELASRQQADGSFGQQPIPPEGVDRVAPARSSPVE
jgi:hypothetical protein